MVHFYKNREITTVIIPATPNAILLIAPCISPNSIALAVPIAVLLQPKPTNTTNRIFDAGAILPTVEQAPHQLHP